MKITTVGIDLAKSVFQVHAVDERGRAVLRKQLRSFERASSASWAPVRAEAIAATVISNFSAAPISACLHLTDSFRRPAVHDEPA
jgi:transposase